MHTLMMHVGILRQCRIFSVFLLCRKDRPTSPTDMINGSSEYFHSTTQRSVSATPPGYKDNYSENYQHSPKSPTRNGSASPTVYFGNSRRSSVHSNSEPPHEVSAANVKFVRDTSKYWYKPTISREEGAFTVIFIQLVMKVILF
jgi:hypothetical protein